MFPNRVELSVLARVLLLNVTVYPRSKNYRRLYFLSVFRFPLRQESCDVLDTLRSVHSGEHVVSHLAAQPNERLAAE